ncbi:MAG TPA: hypothetical protein VFU49_10730 [Ktedonobacteraceae bacterium]|nr:hypothetical protein [Ktedonobacteraceae bacterium]
MASFAQTFGKEDLLPILLELVASPNEGKREAPAALPAHPLAPTRVPPSRHAQTTRSEREPRWWTGTGRGKGRKRGWEGASRLPR